MHIKMNVLAAGLVAGSMMMGSAYAMHPMDMMDDMYIGLEYNLVKTNLKTHHSIRYQDGYRDFHTGLAPVLGFVLHDAFNLELGYLYTGKEHKTMTGTLSGDSYTKLRTLFIDGVTHYPIWDDVCLIGSLGVEHARMKAHVLSSSTLKRHNTSYAGRAGLGLGYKMNDNMSVRFMGRASTATYEGIAAATYTAALGLFYAY